MDNIIEGRVKGLRESGLTHQQIGDLLGFTRQRSHQLYSGYRSVATRLRTKRKKLINTIILRRDDKGCQFCTKQASLIIHHKDKDPGNNKSYNLITICQSCHQILHQGLARLDS